MTADHGIENGGARAGRVLVCFALPEEAAPFRKACTHRPEVSILITGIGRRNARKTVREFLADGRPALVLTCGFAGGLNPALAAGDVVFSTDDESGRLAEVDLARGRPDRSGSDTGDAAPRGGVRGNRDAAGRTFAQGLRERLLAAGAKPARFFCADRVATTASEKRDLRRLTGADAVEMESEAIHRICREGDLPCATVRVVSDAAGEDLPLDFNRLVEPDSGLNYGKLAWAVAKAPGKIGALLRLREQTRFAARELAAALARVI